MATDWKRVLSDIPLEKHNSTTNAYFVPPLFSTGGHNSREDLNSPHGHPTNTSDSEPRAASQPGLVPARGGGLRGNISFIGLTSSPTNEEVKLPPGRGGCDCHRPRSPTWGRERNHFYHQAATRKRGKQSQPSKLSIVRLDILQNGEKPVSDCWTLQRKMGLFSKHIFTNGAHHFYKVTSRTRKVPSS